MASDRSLATSPVVVLACLLAVAPGCALAIQGPDPEQPRREVPRCDTGKGAVVMDGLMTTVLGLGSLAAFADGAEGAGLAIGAAGALFLASAIRGNNAADDCREAFEAYAALPPRQHDPMFARDAEPARRPVAVRRKRKPKRTEPASVTVPREPARPGPPPESIAPAYATPRPPERPSIAEPAQPAPRRSTPAPPDPDAEDWSAFWEEAP